MNVSLRTGVALLAAVLLVGCVVIEKKSLVVIVPPNSKEAYVYYTFEGISVLDSGKSTLDRAKTDVDSLKKGQLNFFVPVAPPLKKYCRFENLRYFSDPDRPRSLCADRRMTILDRDKFAAELNKNLNEFLAQQWMQLDAQGIRDEIVSMQVKSRQPEALQSAKEFGMGPFFKAISGTVELASLLDLESVKKLQEATKNEFGWLRFEEESVRLVLPATPECAQRIVDDPQSQVWLKEMRTFVEPIELQKCDEGLAIVIGKQGSAIQLVFSDDRAHRATDEKELARHAGSPPPVRLPDGTQANAQKLIEQFIAEKIK